ncbi:MAG: acyl--CoA ligase [Clostridiales bacterium]|nr:acyl--CoA ligase [Clostridiales bacterium]
MIYEFLCSKMSYFLDKTIQDETQTITFCDLLRYAETFGEELKKQNTDKIGILCRSNLDTAKALMACFYAHKTAVPLSYRYGEKHNKKIIESIGLSHIITDSGIEVNSNVSVTSSDNLDDVALIMCTSGTTGNPKGAMITHKNIITNVTDIADYFNVHEYQKILISRPLYHCAVLTGEFLISLMKGLDIVFYDGDFHPINILHTIDKHNISVMCGTPTMFYHICALAKKAYAKPLDVIAVSGECMTIETAECLRKTFPNADIYNVYGLTEASPRVCYLPQELFDKYPLYVGFPLRSLAIKIDNGELLVKGPSVMKGYYNNPEATNRILKDGWLHTGDIAEMNESMVLRIKSRKDNMIIRAGMNIYPQEIENTLKQDPRILEVVAYGKQRDMVGQQVCLKAVVDGISKSELFSICKQLLPIYQLPDVIEIVDEIPKNASGKIIRRTGK